MEFVSELHCLWIKKPPVYGGSFLLAQRASRNPSHASLDLVSRFRYNHVQHKKLSLSCTEFDLGRLADEKMLAFGLPPDAMLVQKTWVAAKGYCAPYTTQV